MAGSTIGSSSKLGLLLPALAFVLVFFAASPGHASTAAPGLVFHVGGPRGWRVPDANTSYGWWAMNNRFHVGDKLCEFIHPSVHRRRPHRPFPAFRFVMRLLIGLPF
jgi:hypothetical protein